MIVVYSAKVGRRLTEDRKKNPLDKADFFVYIKPEVNMTVTHMLPKALRLIAEFTKEQIENADADLEFRQADLDALLMLKDSDLMELLPIDTALFIGECILETREDLQIAQSKHDHFGNVWSAIATRSGISPQELEKLIEQSDSGSGKDDPA